MIQGNSIQVDWEPPYYICKLINKKIVKETIDRTHRTWCSIEHIASKDMLCYAADFASDAK